MSISDLIAAAGERLTPTDRRIAASLLDDPSLAVFGTVSDLANRTGASRPSVVRFATRLGFEGFADLQRQARADVAEQLGTPGDRVRRPETRIDATRSAVEASVSQVFAALDSERIAAVAEPIATAERVWVLSGESSRAGAAVLSSGLSMVRPGVQQVEDHHIAREAALAGADDVAAVFDTARYRRSTREATETLAERGVRIVAVTDGALSPLVPLAHAWCEIRVPAIGPFDSSVPNVLAAELIVQSVVSRLGAEATAHIDRLERLWARTSTFLPEP